MTGLILRDIYFLKQNWKVYLGLLIFGMIFSVKTQSSNYLIFVSVFFGISVAFSILTLEEGGGYAYSLCIPVKRKDIIKSTYIAVLGFIAINVLVAGIFSALMCLIGAIPYTLEAIGVMALLLLFCLIIPNIVIPVSVKWSTNRARLIMIGLFFAFTIPLLLLDDMNIFTESELDVWVIAHIQSIMIIMLLTAIAATWISYRISAAIFDKTDF